MRPLSRIALLIAATTLAAPTYAAPAVKSVPIPTLVRQVTIPHSSFTLPNGLKVIVHEDHKTPVVAVSMWYNVGSKDEPKGKTGFAHLFEHLMFNGTENLPGDFFEYLQQIGATDYNGTTSFDRTNYFQTVPKGALERALFMESDRMGHLLGAINQAVLDNQRGVVQNEKRQGDSQPGGLVFYEVLKTLFPEGHPYHHMTIGSMADLDAASLEDVKQWFRDKYGPNNAVLVLAGDINAAEARPLVEKYFGHIARGPVNNPAQASVPRLAQPKSIEMKDAVAATTIQRYWAVPGLLDRRLAALDVGGSVLGGLASSRLDRIMVRDEKIAVGVTGGPDAAAAGRGVHRHRDRAAGRRSGAGVEAARRGDGRLSRQRADRGRSAAGGDGRSVGPGARARAGRRLRRQGGHPCRGRDLCRRTANSTRRRCRPTPRSRRQWSARRCASG